ncbi:response regulator transcription factor [Chelativorans sp. M5D2P16]|uniref:response regulator transcription factor n=1 Tax=Chelativorans sp. M5D2P16 TaxID=3095678 RepID=UPI002ACA96BC|nr:response regulator transcription factor [Chelativorans sp. M5D2P16]MDZ5698457.1 response regulator transcription factor [Chelativorans sp. M5D2P16]
MIIVVDERDLVTEGYNSLFNKEGVATAGFSPGEFGEWVTTAPEEDLQSVSAFLLGQCAAPEKPTRKIRGRSSAPVLVLSEKNSLEDTLRLFESGVDDVVRKPVHVREILARINAITRRMQKQETSFTEIGPMRIFTDGRDPEIDGEPLPLPRRERRILEYLASNASRRVTKTQIFNAIYGIFDDEVEENVVESHISKLRKKLRQKLGFDPIDSKRYLGYRLVG